MKWILLVLAFSLNAFDCDQSGATNYGINNGDTKMTLTGNRDARTLGFESNEDESGIHLHFWNDMNNRDNYYPNLMRHIAEESMQSVSTPPTPQIPSYDSNANHMHINLNELMPQPQPQVSSANLLKSALMQTLAIDDFRKSDQNLYGTFYKLNADRYKVSPLSWNYHPSAINYIPKAYDTNLNAATPVSVKSIASAASMPRSSLHDQMRTSKNFVQDYYTNLHQKKPTSVIDAIGYEIGGLPKYSGRLLANEPMPQRYRTFKMFEPVPRQIMLPPPMHRIPEFKPVPPRLKVISALEDYFDKNQHPEPTQKSLPWKMIQPEDMSKLNYLYPVAPSKPLQMIPFKVSEAITKAPFRNFIPKTEYNVIEPSTEPYHHGLMLSDIETQSLKHFRTTPNQIILPQATTKPPKTNSNIPNQQIHNHKNLIDIQHQINGPFLNNDHKSDSKLQVFASDDHASAYEYTIKVNHKNNGGDDSLKHVSLEEDTRSTFDRNHQPHRIDNDLAETGKKSAYRKAKPTRKPQRTYDQLTNDVIELNVTGFRNFSDENRIGKSGSAENLAEKKESKLKYDDKYGLRLKPLKEYAIENVSADSIQLSQTYSRQTSNVPRYKSKHATKQPDDLRIKLANDVNKALYKSLGNETNANRHDQYGGTNTYDPFLIAVYDQNDRSMRPADLDDDFQYGEADKNGPFQMIHDGNNSIQRIDHEWATDRNDVVRLNVNKRDEHNHNKSESKSKAHDINNANDIENSNKNHLANEMENNVNNINNTTTDDKYYKWFSKYAEENKKLGRTVISEHFKKVEIEPNISWVILPRKNSTRKKLIGENLMATKIKELQQPTRSLFRPENGN